MAKNLTMGTKVPATGGKAMGLKSQPIIGKLAGMSAMPTAKGGLGQAVKTVVSNPISGKASQKGSTPMGSGGIIDGFVR